MPFRRMYIIYHKTGRLANGREEKMEENSKKKKNSDDKSFFVPAIIAETVAVLLASAILLGIKFTLPDTFDKLRKFYGKEIVWSVRTQGADKDGADEV